MDETIEYISQWERINESHFDSLVAELDGVFESVIGDQMEAASNMDERVYTEAGH